ncbi:MAG: FxsA family protein [Myxococcota bacterium]|nr:FxsA family protein [Myxococcota bacterium]
MFWLVFMFTFVPVMELALLVEVGGHLGLFRTLGICFLTGVVGAALARAEGLGVLRRIQEVSARGQLPARELLDGVLIFVAGLVLLTPGFVTDAIGLLLLLPPSRALVRTWLLYQIGRRIKDGSWRVVTPGQSPEAHGAGEPDIYPPDRAPRPPRPEPPKVIDL